jgi:hypothetical protein
MDSRGANARKLTIFAPIETVSAGRIGSRRRAGFDDLTCGGGGKNADLGFINNDNLGDSLVAIRGEVGDVNWAFRTRNANTCKLPISASIEACRTPLR